MLNRIEATALLDWAHAQNPGPWRAHSLHVARAAGAIAEKCGMDGERAWVLGALHDVGRYEGVRGLHHAVAGYALLMEKGDPGAARVCVTHSFPDGRLEHFNGRRDGGGGLSAPVSGRNHPRRLRPAHPALRRDLHRAGRLPDGETAGGRGAAPRSGAGTGRKMAGVSESAARFRAAHGRERLFAVRRMRRRDLRGGGLRQHRTIRRCVP